MSKSNKSPSAKVPEINVFERDIQNELETVEQIAMYLYRYGGRVRARILAHVQELLAYREDGS